MKRGFVLVFVLLIGLSFVSAQEYAIPDNYKELAAQYGIDSDTITDEEINNIASQNGIDVDDIEPSEVESIVKKNNIDVDNLKIDDVKTVAEDLGINDSQLDDIIGGYIKTAGCVTIEEFSKDIVGQVIPSKVPYKNEIFNIYIDSDILGSIIISDGVIINVTCEESAERTYDVLITDYSILLDFIGGFDTDILNEKIKDKDIVVKGVNVWKKLKWWFSKLALRLFF